MGPYAVFLLPRLTFQIGFSRGFPSSNVSFQWKRLSPRLAGPMLPLSSFLMEDLLHSTFLVYALVSLSPWLLRSFGLLPPLPLFLTYGLVLNQSCSIVEYTEIDCLLISLSTHGRGEPWVEDGEADVSIQSV